MTLKGSKWLRLMRKHIKKGDETINTSSSSSFFFFFLLLLLSYIFPLPNHWILHRIDKREFDSQLHTTLCFQCNTNYSTSYCPMEFPPFSFQSSSTNTWNHENQTKQCPPLGPNTSLHANPPGDDGIASCKRSENVGKIFIIFLAL